MENPACSPPGKNAHLKCNTPGLLDHKFAKCLSDVVGSSAVLTRTYVLRSSHPLWNASTQNEGGNSNFQRLAPKNQLP